LQIFIMNERLPAAIFLFFCLCMSVHPGRCDGHTVSLRIELEELRESSARLLIDYPCLRLMYVEHRQSTDAVLQPERWSLGIASALLTAGPVCLEGILAQLYNPLGQGAGGAAFSQNARLCLDIDPDVGSRRGVELSLIPQHWSFFLLYKEAFGAQLGSAAALPIGSRAGCELVAMLSDPPGRLDHPAGPAWYPEMPPFPGGAVSHLAGSFILGSSRSSLRLLAAVSGGTRVGPGALVTLHAVRPGPRTELALLIGHCTAGFTTPEGDDGDLQWLAAARLRWDLRPFVLSATCRREISHTCVLSSPFRESRERLAAEIEWFRRMGPGCALIVESCALVQLHRAASGQVDEECCLEAGATLRRRGVEISAGASVGWGPERPRGGLTELRLLLARDLRWGEIGLETKYRSGPDPGFWAAACLELVEKNRRFHARLESRRPLEPPLRELFSISLGWETKSRRPDQEPRAPQN
jgi:hypothetical protein